MEKLLAKLKNVCLSQTFISSSEDATKMKLAINRIQYENNLVLLRTDYLE